MASNNTTIEWTDVTWSPVTGCDRVSPGCDHCYALTLAKRLKGMGSAKYQNDGDPRTSGPGFLATEHPNTLTDPLHWRKPRKVFVNSMSDLFHERISEAFIAKVFAVMAATPRHTYQVLTKRHGRMRSLLSKPTAFVDTVLDYLSEIPGGQQLIDEQRAPWPLPNVWLGVSVETQQWADIRIPALLDTPAAVRWLSCEPLLGPVDIHLATTPWDNAAIDWVVLGGESGLGARPMHPAWARSVRDYCRSAGIPFLYKQTGAWAPQDVARYSDLMPMSGDGRGCVVELDGSVSAAWTMGGRDAREGCVTADGAPMLLVGKKRAGRVLDGRTWDEFPVSVGGEG